MEYIISSKSKKEGALMARVFFYVSLVFILSSCMSREEQIATYSSQYPIEGVKLPKCPNPSFCEEKKTECIFDVKNEFNKVFSKKDENQDEEISQKALVSELSDQLLNVEPHRKYCKKRYFFGNYGISHPEDCPKVMDIVCDRVYKKCMENQENCSPSDPSLDASAKDKATQKDYGNEEDTHYP